MEEMVVIIASLLLLPSLAINNEMGNGSEDNPYVTGGWEINASGYCHAISSDNNLSMENSPCIP